MKMILLSFITLLIIYVGNTYSDIQQEVVTETSFFLNEINYPSGQKNIAYAYAKQCTNYTSDFKITTTDY